MCTTAVVGLSLIVFVLQVCFPLEESGIEEYKLLVSGPWSWSGSDLYTCTVVAAYVRAHMCCTYVRIPTEVY